MMVIAFSLCHNEFVRNFPFTGFEECLMHLENMEVYVQSPEQQEKHDALVDATYEFYEVMGTEDLGYVICTE